MILDWCRHTLVFTLIYSLVFSGVPFQAYAIPAKPKTMEEIKENFELMVPVRQDDTFGELYYRIETRLVDEQKDEFAALNKKLNYKAPASKVPKIAATADSLTIREGKEEMVIKVKADKDGELVVTVNDQVVSEDVLRSPLKSYSFLEKLMSKPSKGKKTSWLWHMLVPNAEAMNWMAMLTGAASLGVIGYLFWQKQEAAKPACRKEGQTCCNVNSQEVQNSNGCCSEIGGLKTGASVCLPKMYVTPEAETSSTGVK